ncbi:hypothetical protein [Seonamhaeicola marinus]|uniref:Uncharacterized protein n=1 Tax=Seonamhaeicola marinus TaxID=1912246 RepID=A0A5D0HU28_9FLAO|nr:hypothetical protein [Seonamhaeicola marinus]TYA74818.1 hypothetical protein FUA24_16045 [Seonamhaeicola marinus]
MLQLKKKKMKNNMNKLLLVITILFFNCLNYESPSRLLNALNDIDYSSNDTIDLKQVYSFEWDSLYIFREFVEPEAINEIIGLDCECDMVPDSLELYIFINDKEIVKKVIVEAMGYDFYVEEYLDFEKSIKIESISSKFKVVNNKNNYILKPIM